MSAEVLVATELARVTRPIMQHPGEIVPFLAWVLDRGPLTRVLEIGAGHGGLTELLCRLTSGQMVSVDLPDGATSGLDLARCRTRNAGLRREFPTVYSGYLGDSHDDTVWECVCDTFDGPLDLLFIDGDHSYEGIRADLRGYRALVRPGGIVAFHDINAVTFAGVDVPALWTSLEDPTKRLWSVGANWGGIGSIEV